jgi:ribonuclease-3
MSDSDIKKLESIIGYQFKDKQLIIEALTHKSFKKPYNNERLEFLGDAVLDLIVGEYLFKKFPNSDEGTLSKIRAAIVNEDGFTALAKDIELGEFLYLSSAEENNKGRSKTSLLSNAFEALIGAIYLDASLDEAKRISVDLIEKNHPQIDLDSLCKDYKTTLQEYTQAEFGVTPQYELLKATGPDHDKVFEVGIYLNKKLVATAKGKSKKSAQKEAARLALTQLKEKK